MDATGTSDSRPSDDGASDALPADAASSADAPPGPDAPGPGADASQLDADVAPDATSALDAATVPDAIAPGIDAAPPGDAAVTDAGAPDAPSSIDLSGWTLTRTWSGSPVVFAVPAGTVLAPGEYLVLVRNSDPASFGSFWNVNVPAGAHYIDTDDALVMVNGTTSFTLKDPGGAVIDGPTYTFAASLNAQRKVPPAAAGVLEAWTTADAAVKSNATPGAGQVPDGAFAGVYISEVADAVGTGMYIYEYVELFFDP